MKVAPYVGAWIETLEIAGLRNYGWSHPTWVRGLKQASLNRSQVDLKSHPTWVRGLKLLAVKRSRLRNCRTLRGCVD